MKKNLLVLLCMLLVAMCALASCNNDSGNNNGTGNGNNNEACEHEFSDEWYSDATSHWHPALCEHGEIKNGLAEHSDADEDGFCDVCANELGHDHTFATEWSFDEFYHWKNATCTHTDNKGEYSLHSDELADGTCDDCGSHVHKLNPMGFCTIESCGKKVKEVDVTDLDSLVNAVYYQSHLVNGGTVDYKFTGLSNAGVDFTASKHDKVVYTYGKDDYTYTKIETDAVNAGVSASSTLETWHQLKGEDSVFGVAKEGLGGITLDLPEVARLRGYFFSLSTLAGDYGAMETLYALYLAAADSREDGSLIGDVEITFPENENKVTFKYDYKTVLLNASDITYGELAGTTVYNVNYFEVEVSFCYNEDFALTELWISCDCYTNDAGALPNGEANEADIDLDYDPATGEFTMRENALADNYEIHVTQTVGEKTEENPYPQSMFVPESFSIYLTKEPTYDSEGLENGYTLLDKLSGKISVDTGDIVHLYISDYSPSTASLHFIAEHVTFKLYKNGVEVQNPEDYENQTAVAMFTYAGDLRSFFVVPKTDGAYKLEIFVMGEKKAEVDINAGAVDEEYIDYDKNKEFVAKVTEAFEWTNVVEFTATDAGTYKFLLPVGFGLIDADSHDVAMSTEATDDTGIIYYDFQDLANRNPDGSYIAGSFTIYLEAGETIRFYANAAKKGNYIIGFRWLG